MNPPSITLNEIQNLLGLPRNQVRNMMKKQGVQHDGTPEMRYPRDEATKTIEKHISVKEKETKKRAVIAERRSQKNSVYYVALESTQTCTENERSLVSKSEAAIMLDCDSYKIKEAVRYGLISSPESGKFLTEEITLLVSNGNFMEMILEAKSKYKESMGFPEEDHSEKPESARHEDKVSVVFTNKDYFPDVNVRIPRRNGTLNYVGFHLGPTNSGKTYNALESMCKEYEDNPEGKYVYSGPLRMLAYEVYTKMVARYGENAVGFITGEESINPEAPIIAATVEMTPLEGNVVIIDEAHWIRDTERGHYWTRLLSTGKYQSMHIIAAQEAAEGLSELVSDALTVESDVFERRTGISYDGETIISKIKPKTALVAFSRTEVYKKYNELLYAGKKACVLYGALPAEVRKNQIRDYENGDYDIVVTTNVIGHGINLPIDNVVFASTERFDGFSMIELPLWEAGQISGRAGRYGFTDKGHVLALSKGGETEVDTQVIRDGVNVAAGRLESGLEVERPFIAPSFTDLGLPLGDNHHLFNAMQAWSAEVSMNTQFSPSPMNTVIKNLKIVVEQLDAPMEGLNIGEGKGFWRMDSKTLWDLASGPFSPKSPVVRVASDWLNSKNPENSHEIRRNFMDIVRADKNMELSALEKSFEAVSEFKMLSVAFGDNGKLGTLPVSAIYSMEKTLVDLIQWKLDNYKFPVAKKAQTKK